ncbi:hypothetical protein KVT40_000183 [Elsinoe batatas]|uniref:Uncharacterized protein n=1 Tax=Elsinoe batatas TaxID=2601811 RepID=A0A8K0LF48_9PEZI|nr:hypothetical protein KVT40_000183 [Elsinoe batatas]
MYRPSPHVRMNDKFETNVHRENIIAKRSRVLARFYRLTAAEYGTKVQQGLWAVRERSWDHLERRLETIEDEETMDMNEQNFLEAWHRRLDFVEQFRGSDGEYRPEYAMEMVKFWNKNKPHTLPRMSLFTLELFVPEKLGETLRDIKRRSDWEWEMVDKRSLNFTHVDYGRLMASIAQFSPMEMDPTPPHVVSSTEEHCDRSEGSTGQRS